MSFPIVKPTNKEIELCKSCKNAFLKCDSCVPGSSNYEKEYNSIIKCFGQYNNKCGECCVKTQCKIKSKE